MSHCIKRSLRRLQFLARRTQLLSCFAGVAGDLLQLFAVLDAQLIERSQRHVAFVTQCIGGLGSLRFGVAQRFFERGNPLLARDQRGIRLTVACGELLLQRGIGRFELLELALQIIARALRLAQLGLHIEQLIAGLLGIGGQLLHLVAVLDAKFVERGQCHVALLAQRVDLLLGFRTRVLQRLFEFLDPLLTLAQRLVEFLLALGELCGRLLVILLLAGAQLFVLFAQRINFLLQRLHRLIVAFAPIEVVAQAFQVSLRLFKVELQRGHFLLQFTTFTIVLLTFLGALRQGVGQTARQVVKIGGCALGTLTLADQLALGSRQALLQFLVETLDLGHPARQ